MLGSPYALASFRRALAVATIAFAWLTPQAARAAVDCSNTIVDPASPLTDDYDSNHSVLPCIKLTNGADLDLDGHSITKSGLNAASAAIRCTSAGSEVTNGSTTSASVIDGNFTRGVHDCEVVTNLTIDGASLTPGVRDGIVNISFEASTIEGNVIDGVLAGIEAALFDRNSIVRNNYISASNQGIQVTGTTDGSGPIVEWNVIRRSGYNCIAKTGTDKIRIRKNMCTNRNGASFPGTGKCLRITATGTTLSDNTCDCLDEAENCGLEPPAAFPFL